MAEMSQTFPEGLKYAIHYDTTKFIGQAIHAVYETLFEAGILVLIVIMVFLQNWRAMLVPATTVPVTIIGAFAAMALLGFTVNLMTLFALILAIGIVVDDAIVIVENASSTSRRGFHPREATIKAMEEIDRTGHRHHPGADRGFSARRLHAGHHRAALPAVRPGHRLHRHHQRHQRPDPEAGPVRPLVAPPRQKGSPTSFTGGSIRSTAMVEHAYVVLVGWMVQRTTLMVLVFVARHRPGRLAVYPAAHRLSAHGRPGLRHGGGPAARWRGPTPGQADRGPESDAILKRTPGFDAWVTIGGFSILDAANVSNIMTTFVIYQDWDKRGRPS